MMPMLAGLSSGLELLTAFVTAVVTARGAGIAGSARDGALARAVAGGVLERRVVAVDHGDLEQAEDDHEEDGRAERELHGRLAALAPHGCSCSLPMDAHVVGDASACPTRRRRRRG